MATETKTIHYGNASREQREYVEAKIRQELGGCQSCLVDDALAKGFFNYEDIQNYYYSYEQAKECGIIDDDVKEEDYDSEPQEIFEWWPIESSFLVEDLLKMGEPVLSNDYGDWWGRTCTGQAIYLDPTFWDIFQDHIKTI